MKYTIFNCCQIIKRACVGNVIKSDTANGENKSIVILFRLPVLCTLYKKLLQNRYYNKTIKLHDKT